MRGKVAAEWSVALILMLLSSFCSYGAEPSKPIWLQCDKREFDKLLLPLLHHARGAVVIGLTNGRTHRILAYGELSDGNRRKPSGETIFEIGSLTKVFTCLLLVDLWRDGKLSFDDRASSFLAAGTRVPDYQGKPVTLFHLATHTSGLPRDPDNYLPHSLKYDKNQFHAFLQRCRLMYPPGSKYSYSNAGVTLLGEALEGAGHESYWNLLQQRILRPLGLKDTTLVLDLRRRNRLAQGHGSNGLNLPDSASSGGPSGGLKSTADDLLGLLDVALSASQESSGIARDIAESCRRRFRVSRSEFSCLGWSYDRPADIYYKTGQVDGYSTYIEFSPSRQGAGVVLSATLAVDAAKVWRRLSAALPVQVGGQH